MDCTADSDFRTKCNFQHVHSHETPVLDTEVAI